MENLTSSPPKLTDNQIDSGKILNVAVIVAALGYFVDVYDLVLFLIIGIDSLKALNIPGDSIKNFQFLLNVQMIGMLIGGIFWGILGDKKGRLSVLFGSIIMYSVANILNGMVDMFSPYEMESYILLRFIAGLGLAGELGAGVTLVAESMSKEKRGYGTMIIASVGVVGAVVAGLVSKGLGWKLSYYIGGSLGLSLLLLRIGVFESGIFKKLHDSNVEKGDFFMLFKSKERALRFLNSILIGLPVWFVIGILVGRAPVFAELLSVNGKIIQADCVVLCYSGLVFGDLLSGGLSQLVKSRRKAVLTFYTLCVGVVLAYLNVKGLSTTVFYSLIFALGLSVGFWATFVTMAAEQFGTNLRATVTTTVPNFVRGSLVPIALLFDTIAEKSEGGIVTAGLIVMVIIMVISGWALKSLNETFGRDLDYLEK
jgi:MFS transporter, putative metabolite:H+ symporter